MSCLIFAWIFRLDGLEYMAHVLSTLGASITLVVLADGVVQPDAFTFVFLRQFKRAAIPGDAVRRILHAQRVKPVAAIGGPVERQFHRPIVRQIDDAPKRIGKLFRRRPGTGAGVFQVQRVRPVIAEMKFPVPVERKVFARRFGSGKLHGQQRGAGSGNKSAKSGNEFHFYDPSGDQRLCECEHQERILSAKAILPLNFSGSETCKPFSSRANFTLPPPTSRTLPILPGQFAELVSRDLMLTLPSFGISNRMA